MRTLSSAAFNQLTQNITDVQVNNVLLFCLMHGHTLADTQIQYLLTLTGGSGPKSHDRLLWDIIIHDDYRKHAYPSDPNGLLLSMLYDYLTITKGDFFRAARPYQEDFDGVEILNLFNKLIRKEREQGLIRLLSDHATWWDRVERNNYGYLALQGLSLDRVLKDVPHLPNELIYAFDEQEWLAKPALWAPALLMIDKHAILANYDRDIWTALLMWSTYMHGEEVNGRLLLSIDPDAVLVQTHYLTTESLWSTYQAHYGLSSRLQEWRLYLTAIGPGDSWADAYQQFFIVPPSTLVEGPLYD